MRFLFIGLFALVFATTSLSVEISPEDFKVGLNSAKAGVSTSQFNTAYAYHHGTGTKQNKEQALYWYLEAAKSNNSAVRYKIGRLYETGSVLPKVITEAVKHYRFAVKNGDPNAQANMGVLYMQGRGVEKNIDKGLELMTMAAENYSLEAQVNLANFYRSPGKYKDVDKSLHWLGLAAGGNSGYAQMELGKYHLSIKKYDIAKRLFTQAIVNDMIEGNLMLAMMYDKGLGVTRDTTLVKEYLSTAASAGNTKAKQMLKQLAKAAN